MWKTGHSVSSKMYWEKSREHKTNSVDSGLPVTNYDAYKIIDDVIVLENRLGWLY